MRSVTFTGEEADRLMHSIDAGYAQIKALNARVLALAIENKRLRGAITTALRTVADADRFNLCPEYTLGAVSAALNNTKGE